MMQDENILIRALEPEDLEYLYKWENDMDLWDVSDTLTPFSHFTLKKYIENAHVDIYTSKQLRLMITRAVSYTHLITGCTSGIRIYHNRLDGQHGSHPDGHSGQSCCNLIINTN